MTARKLLVGASALAFSSTGAFALQPTAISADTVAPTDSLVSSSISPIPSASAEAITCAEKASGFTFSHTTSKGLYDITCGSDYPGNDLKFIWTDSFDACVVACDDEKRVPHCGLSFWCLLLKERCNEPSCRCQHLGGEEARCQPKASDSGPTCMSKASDATTYASSSGSTFKIVCGKEYWGGDLSGTSTTSFKECIETCSTTSGCVDVSYVDGACYLKSSKSSLVEAGHVWTAELIDLNATASTASASPTASAAAGKDLTCLESKDDKKPYTAANGGKFVVECGVDYFGNDLTAVDSSSFATCMDACDSTDGCVDVSYVWGRCYMKTSVTSSSPAGHVWTGRKTSAATDSEILSSLQEEGGSFCTAYIGYQAPVTTTVTTTTPDASTVLRTRTETSTSTKLITSYATATSIQTFPWLEPRQAVPTPAIVSGLPAPRISSICSLVATGTSTRVSTATASIAPTTQISTFTSIVPVTRVTVATTLVTSSKRLPNPTAAVNLDFEAGDLFDWTITNREAGFSSTLVSPGHPRSGLISNYGVAISKEAGPINGYGFSEVRQATPNLVPGQTYRIEFSWKYTINVDSSDVCNTFITLWGIQLAALTPSTTSKNLQDRQRHFLVTMPQCGNSLAWTMTLQPAQSPGEWKRYTT